MATQFISTNKNYKRLFDAPLDPTVTFPNLSALNNYLNDPTCYESQIIGCQGKIYIVYIDNGVKYAKSITKGKFDDVILTEDGVLNFYADGELVKSVQLPTRYARAICGEFLCGELPVGHNVKRTLGNVDFTTPTVWIDNETPVDSFNMNTIEDKIVTLKGLVDLKSAGYHVGTSPPSDTSLMWIDTSDENFSSTIDDSILNELKATISAMQKKIIQLEADVEYLKLNGGGPPPIIPGDDFSILTEEGDTFITEHGDTIVLEEYTSLPPIESNYSILTEEGEILITENGDLIVLEDYNTTPTSNYILTENNEQIVTEDNLNLILEGE